MGTNRIVVMPEDTKADPSLRLPHERSVRGAPSRYVQDDTRIESTSRSFAPLTPQNTSAGPQACGAQDDGELGGTERARRLLTVAPFLVFLFIEVLGFPPLRQKRRKDGAPGIRFENAVFLEDYLAAKLEFAGIEGAGYLSKVAVGESRVDTVELGVVEGIEGFHAEFKMRIFFPGKGEALE